MSSDAPPSYASTAKLPVGEHKMIKTFIGTIRIVFFPEGWAQLSPGADVALKLLYPAFQYVPKGEYPRVLNATYSPDTKSYWLNVTNSTLGRKAYDYEVVDIPPGYSPKYL